jgi:hypothetical protein
LYFNFRNEIKLKLDKLKEKLIQDKVDINERPLETIANKPSMLIQQPSKTEIGPILALASPKNVTAISLDTSNQGAKLDRPIIVGGDKPSMLLSNMVRQNSKPMLLGGDKPPSMLLGDDRSSIIQQSANKYMLLGGDKPPSMLIADLVHAKPSMILDSNSNPGKSNPKVLASNVSDHRHSQYHNSHKAGTFSFNFKARVPIRI